MSVEIGQEAPDFELPNTEGARTRLSAFRGKKNVLLLFYPFAFSPVCSIEFKTLRDENADLQSDKTEVIGVSVDPRWALKAWKDRDRFVNQFVSDFWPHGDVSRAYGAFMEDRGHALRATFVIDKQGIVRWKEINQPTEPRDQSGWRKALDQLQD